MRIKGAWLVVFTVVALGVAAMFPAAASAASLNLVLGAPMPTRDGIAYPLRVIARGTPVVAIFPPETLLATLEIDGAIVRRAGRLEFTGNQPLGRGGASLVLADLRPGQHVVLRIRGTRVPPRLLPDSDVLFEVYRSGIFTGIIYGLMLTAILFDLAALAGAQDRHRLWYVGVVVSLAAGESLRNDAWSLTLGSAPVAFGICGLGLAICVAGFAATYLNLRTHSPKLFWFAIVGNAQMPFGVCFAQLLPSPLCHTLLPVPPLVAYGSLIVVSWLRWRAGFRPAALLIVGLCSMFAYLALSFAVDLFALSLPFFDWWGYEIATVFDLLVFRVGIVYRDRFSARLHVEMERQLQAATFAAAHDELTELLNRRGLEAWIEAHPAVAGTLLYLDIDGFKAVNDQGGHPAGDDTLRLVARLLRRAVRDGDQVARMGGDEFLVLLPDVADDATAQDVMRRITDGVEALLPLGSDDPTRIGISIGSGVIAGASSFAAALSAADLDLYRQKSAHHASTRRARERGETSKRFAPTSTSPAQTS